MPRNADLAGFMTRIGYTFANREHLTQALTHSSASTAARPSNQRLEFVGDRVLGLVMAEELMKRFPDEQEGGLAARYNQLVRRESCARVAATIGLPERLQMARSEVLSGGRKKQTLQADAVEALIAAIYLDGGLEPSRNFILQEWADLLDDLRRKAPQDAKTELQEWVQARGLPLPAYSVVSQEGPDHNPRFQVIVKLANGLSASASASTKRGAEQEAAQNLLKAIRGDAP